MSPLLDLEIDYVWIGLRNDVRLNELNQRRFMKLFAGKADKAIEEFFFLVSAT